MVLSHHGLCERCDEFCRELEPYLKEKKIPPMKILDRIQRWWYLHSGSSISFEAECSLCDFSSKFPKYHSCINRYACVTLEAQTMKSNEFVPVSDTAAVYLRLKCFCNAKSFCFLEDEQQYHLLGTPGHAHQVNPKLDESDWRRMRYLIESCVDGHGAGCLSPDVTNLAGFEVIDCNTRKLVPGGRRTSFAALSYVWGCGNSDEPPLDRANLPNPFPEDVIEDAMICTKKLNIPYLWVDRYCIDQNDSKTSGKEAKTIKQHLIQNMDRIYSAARVTIINVAGVDTTTGLPGVSTTLRVSPPAAFIYDRKVVLVPNPKEEITRSRWAERGWTLQEGLVAPRRLVFTETQVYFQCTRSHCLESIGGVFKSDEFGRFDTRDDFRQSTQVFPSSTLDSSSYFARTCNEFAQRNLTNDSDALKACLGIFSRFWTSEKDRVYHYYGLPFQDVSTKGFAVALLWDYYTEETYTLSRRAWGPSWSWVTWRGLEFIHFGLEELKEFELFPNTEIKVRQVDKAPSTINDYVDSINNNELHENWLPEINITGWIATVHFQVTDFGNTRPFFAKDQGAIGMSHLFRSLMTGALVNNDETNVEGRKRVMFIAHHGDSDAKRRQLNIHCLILQRVRDTMEKKYLRLGTCSIDTPSHEPLLIHDGENMPTKRYYIRERLAPIKFLHFFCRMLKKHAKSLQSSGF
ncbi:HET-domain-containing protein [Karstenula rhodostoma CBS 690.94]|uniref:HET-domain-containing protein n=1 Tax=Karstenula rhodostoma CBS 690.94 TaxID=1392251 RepID=A0A9P4PHV5_9PLEO|nr:HET-domain-containing protein [Karstenula rhodostoma CBS 690.94]